ncbi:MAG: 30S ribosomal protein S21 [Candidatus Taylorbacteria bacterium]|nr:30S ribosomal protein S21 [Candidatus Taylorbacteria bacterium]
MINVEITRNPNENGISVIRRFTKKVQSSGVLPRVRSIRYSDRTLSPYKVKMKTLKTINRKAEIAELIKMGKMAEKPSRYSK